MADVIGEVDDHRPDNFADHLVDEKVAISQYSLSASVACGKVRRSLINYLSCRRLTVSPPRRSSVALSKTFSTFYSHLQLPSLVPSQPTLATFSTPSIHCNNSTPSNGTTKHFTRESSTGFTSSLLYRNLFLFSFPGFTSQVCFVLIISL